MKHVVIVSVVLLAACNNGSNSSDYDPNIVVPPKEVVAAPAIIPFNIISVYPHDTSAFTEGLQVYKGKLYEGTGLENESSLRITDIKTGRVEKKHFYTDPVIFGEGINVFKNKIYQLTWKNHVVYVFDEKNIDKPLKTLNWPYQGWGMTNNGTDLIVSDGTPLIYFVNPDDFSVKNSIQVKDDKGPVTYLNELEYIDGFIYANVFETNIIVKINPANGHVVGKIILPGIIQQYAPDFIANPEKVLNGIAWDSTTKKMYITGKKWPKLFEITIQ